MYVGRAPRTFLGDCTAQPERSRSPGDPTSRVALVTIPDGSRGMVATLRVMRDFARAAIRDPDQRIRAKALDILSGLPPRQRIAEIRALHAFVRDQIRYTRDPVDVELVQIPEKTLEFGQGDCDDKATLLASLLMSTGHPARFCAVGFDGGGFSHVLVETPVGNGWMPLETIIPVDMGWFPEDVRRVYRLKV